VTLRRPHRARSALLLAAAALLVSRPARPQTAAAAHGTVEAGTFTAPSLGVSKRYRIYLPPSYGHAPARRYPVLYLLHGAWGNEDDWVRLGHLDTAMDTLIAAGLPEFIVVMPDGDDGFYVTWADSVPPEVCGTNPHLHEPAATYCVLREHYDTYIAGDLVTFVDAAYRTIPDRAHRGIAGLSMGGYGAITLALKYPDLWAAAVSMSGVLSPLNASPAPFRPPPRYVTSLDSLRAAWGHLWPLFGPVVGADTAAWAERDPAVLARRALEAGAHLPALSITCGSEDSFVTMNRAFAWELRRLHVRFDYAEFTGQHDWSFWRSRLPDALRWMARHLRR